MRPVRSMMTVLALTAAACGVTACGVQDAPTSSPRTYAALVKDFNFLPEQIDVTTGTTVVWTNRDRFGHTVTFGVPGDRTGTEGVLGETSTNDAAGLTYERTFTEPGTYQFFCRYHPTMTGEIVVTD